MRNWFSRIDKDGNPKDLRAPDGTIIEIYRDKCTVITSDGYRVQIDSNPLSFHILSRLDNHNGKALYERMFEAK